MSVHDLNHPDWNPPDCPEWAKEALPEDIQRFRGRNGMPPPYCDRPNVIAPGVRGIDRYQANQFITYRPETAEFLYSHYTPLQVKYRRGLLPKYEALVEELTAGCYTDVEKALVLLHKGASRVKHPSMPPCGKPVRTDRNLDDEALLESGQGYCNEQARVYTRLCQVAGIPARIVHTFYSDLATGHTIVECYLDGKWRMADASWLVFFPGADGQFLSAVECHDRGEGQKHCGLAYHNRMQELLAMSDEELGLGLDLKAEVWRPRTKAMTPETWTAKMHIFAIINNPLPR